VVCFIRSVEPPALLLIQRRRAPDRGRWNAPGGGLEPGETPEEACRREVREETGLRLDLVHCRAVLTLYGWDGDPETTERIWVFTAEAPSDVRVIPEGWESPSGEGWLTWVPPAEARRLNWPEDVPLYLERLFDPMAPDFIGEFFYDGQGHLTRAVLAPRSPMPGLQTPEG